MKTYRLFCLPHVMGVILLFAGVTLRAAPLTWFHGPSLDVPLSGAATTVAARLGNVLVGGDAGYYLQILAATNNYWSFLQPLQNIQIAPGAIANSDMIIVYGGSDGTASTDAVMGYGLTDPAPALAHMIAARSYLGYAPDASSRAYAIGGLDASGQPLASAERFNPNSDSAGTWSAIAAMPAPRFDFPAVFDRTNQIYIFGGYTDTASGVESASVLRYSVSKNTWTNLAAMPFAVAGSAATLGPDGKIYVVGGLSGGAATNVVQVYNPVSNTWTISTPLPEALSGAAAATDSLGRLLVMGGTDSNGDDVSDLWRSQPLNVPDAAPVFTNFPSTNGTYLATYTSALNATGNPPPVYTLINGPAGITVDYYSGAISWTPQDISQIGTIPVTVQAANYAGTTNYSFTITIPNPPPTVISNLTVVGVTESSVTLSWSPEDPTVGPVTYSVYLRHVLHSPKGSGATIWYTQIGSATTATTITINGLAAGLSQAYYVVATGVSGQSGYAGIGAATLSAPPPTNLRMTGLTSTTISLSWNPPVNSLPIVSYRILGVYNGVFAQYPLKFANITNTFYTVTGLAPGTVLQLGVAAVDSYGNVSTYDYLPSLVINPVPVAPHLSVAAVAVAPTPAVSHGAVSTANITTPPANGFQIAVSAGSSGLQTFLIQATTNPADPNSWEQIGSIMPDTSPFTFTDTSSAQYPVRYYRVVAP